MKVKSDLAQSGLQQGLLSTHAQTLPGHPQRPAIGRGRVGLPEVGRVLRDGLLMVLLALSVGSVGIGHYLAGLVGAMLCIVACTASAVPNPNPYEKRPYDPDDRNEGF